MLNHELELPISNFRVQKKLQQMGLAIRDRKEYTQTLNAFDGGSM